MTILKGSMAGMPTVDDEARQGLHEVVALEEQALRRWLSGDPSGFLELCADDVVYFDPFLPQRLNGKVELAAHYAPLTGKVHADRYEIIHPNVQLVGPAAVLTFNFASWSGGEDPMRWNCTEVYRREGACWRIVQTHWSFAQPTA